MKTRRRGMQGSALAIAVLTAAACADTTAPESSDSVLLNAAVVVADATVEDVALATSGFTFGPLGTAGAGMGWLGGGPGEPGGRRGIGGPLSGTREVTFYDQAGGVQTAYDPTTTASVHVLLDLAGDVVRGPWSAAIERSRDLTVTGLEGEEAVRTFNGTGTEVVSRSRTAEDGAETTHDMSGSFTWNDVVVPVPGSETPWPVSGSIHRVMTISVVNGLQGDFTRTVDVTVTFDGDQTATALIDGESVEIDLAAARGRYPISGGRFCSTGG